MQRRPQVSIAALMGLVILTAVSLAALKNPSEIWAGSIFGLVLVIFACAAVLTVVRHGRDRSVWGGMAIFGLIYLYAAFSGEISSPPLPTTFLLDKLVETVHGGSKRPIYYSAPPSQGGFNASGVGGISSIGIIQRTKHVPVGHFDLYSYQQIGHALLAILFGGVGAIFGTLTGTRRESSAHST